MNFTRGDKAINSAWLQRVHAKHVRQLFPAPSSAQDLPEKRRRGRRLELRF